MSQAQQMVKHSSIYAVGNISRQLVGFIMLPIYTHYLTPADYGVIGLLVFLVSLFEIILGGHMFQAVPKFYHQEDDPKRKNSVVSTAFLVTTCFSGLACLLMASFSEPLSRVTFGDEKYSIYIIIFSALILTHALEIYSLTYLRILKKPWTFFNFNMTKLALQLGLNIYTIVILDWGLMGLALSSLLSSVIIALALMAYTLKRTGLSLKKDIAINIIKFSWPLWISGLIGLYIGSSNKYFIRIFSNLDEVGLYELAAKFGSIVMVLIWSPFSQYWQTERFAIARTENPYPAYSLAFRMITGLLLISGIGVAVFSSSIIYIMSDASFYPAVDAIPFLIIACTFQSLTIFNNFSFMYTNNTFEVTKNNIFTACAITVFYFTLIPNFGFVGAAAAFAAGSIAQYIYALYAGNRIYPLQISQKPLAAGLLIMALGTAIDYYFIEVGLLFESFALKALLAMITSLLIIVVIFNKEERQQLIKYLQRHISKKASK